MKTEQITGAWKEMKGKLKERWGKLTDDDLRVVEGRQDQLVGMLEKRYGYAKDRAEKEANEFYRGCGC